MNVLISLQRGYGLGDAVQMSAVLSHVKKYRPDWIFDFQAQEGQECVGRGIARNTFMYNMPFPSTRDEVWYDEEVQILLRDKWYGWTDRPNTRVSSALHERFGLDWDAECGRYQIQLTDQVKSEAASFVTAIAGSKNAVAIHYRGDTAQEKKNLTDYEAIAVCQEVVNLRAVPLIIDWCNENRFDGGFARVYDRKSHSKWGPSAERNCAMIQQCDAFVGIDSGPGKCASATDTPSLIVWTGHHPAAFHDPAPNTTHLVPEGVHQMPPVSGNRGVMDWFNAHYNFRTYRDDPVNEIKRWLREVLR